MTPPQASPNRRRFLGGFVATLSVILILNVWPHFKMRLHGVNDGFDRLGFPFTFRSEGGIAGTAEFSLPALLADIAFALLAASAIGYVRTALQPRT